MSETWTYWRGDWHQGDLRILGAASHATWPGSPVFDGACLFEGVAPDPDRHSARGGEVLSTGNISKVVPCVGFEGRDLSTGPITTRACALYW